MPRTRTGLSLSNVNPCQPLRYSNVLVSNRAAHWLQSPPRPDMAVLVTRPHPDNEATARVLRRRGFAVLLAPMLRFEPVAWQEDLDDDFAAVIATSANALRAAESELGDLGKLPLFAVGEHTAEAARRAGFAEVIAADGDAAKLRKRVRKSLKAGEEAGKLLYLAGAELSRDLAGELAADGFEVVTRTTYRMVALPSLPREARPLAATAASAIHRAARLPSEPHWARRWRPRKAWSPRARSSAAHA